MYNQPRNHRKACHHPNSSNKIEIVKENKSFENSLFTMAKKVAYNFALASNFYKSYYQKGNEFNNLNHKTIKEM